MLAEPTKSYSFETKLEFQFNRLMAFFSSLILVTVLGIFASSIINDIIQNGYTAKQIVDFEKYEDDRTIKFLNRSALYYYKLGAYHQALQELRLSHNIHSNRYEVNYITAITLISTCRQRGSYCEEAVAKLEYLDKYWHMDREWMNRQYLTLGIIHYEQKSRDQD